MNYRQMNSHKACVFLSYFINTEIKQLRRKKARKKQSASSTERERERFEVGWLNNGCACGHVAAVVTVTVAATRCLKFSFVPLNIISNTELF